MAKKPEYPLEQVLAVKQERVKRAEKAVDEKTRALEIEEEKLKKVEGERDEVKRHYQEKVDQLAEAFEKGTTADEILQKKAYLKVVDERLKKAEARVKEQMSQVQAAEKALEEAKEELRLKRLEEEKIVLHKQEWEKETRKELAKQEAKDQDEIGQLLHESHKRKNK